MNFFNLNAPYKSAVSRDSERFNYGTIDFQFTTGNQACECIASTSVYNHLCSAKQTIETCNPDDWDEMKKVTNPYEYIHTAVPGYKYPVSKFKPLSRSFYKMIEIIKQCKLLPASSAYRLPSSGSNDDRHEYHPPYHQYYHYQYPYMYRNYHKGPGGGGHNNNTAVNGYGRGGGCYGTKRQNHYNNNGNGFYKHQPFSSGEDVTDDMAAATTTADGVEMEMSVEPSGGTASAAASAAAHTSSSNTSSASSSTSSSTSSASSSTDMEASIQTFHLAEGPGGFIEALCYLRANPSDTYYGMTLVDDVPNSACPGWKKSRLFLDRNPYVKLEYGKDGTGNLLSLDNYLHCCEKYRHSMDIVTADGGFDFSSNFNHQEVLAQTLVVSEVLYALSLQKPGGNFVLKIFDTFTRVTVDIIHLLAAFYTDVIIIKPNTSRVANSEKYIVCKGFKTSPAENGDLMIETFRTFFEKLQTVKNVQGSGIGAILRSCEFHKLHIIHRIEEVNAILGQQQIENIINTVALVHGKPADRVDVYKKSHIQKCVDWCERYNIPYNKHSVTTNTFMGNGTGNA